MSDAKIGRPEIPQNQYDEWLDELRPFLKMGETLYAAINDAGLSKHKNVIYQKSRSDSEFQEKIDLWRSFPGKLANNILVRRLIVVDEKIKQGLEATEEDMKIVRFIAEKHRSSQAYFVNRQETAEARPIEDVLVELNNDVDVGHDQVAEAARAEVEKQAVVLTSP